MGWGKVRRRTDSRPPCTEPAGSPPAGPPRSRADSAMWAGPARRACTSPSRLRAAESPASDHLQRAVVDRNARRGELDAGCSMRQLDTAGIERDLQRHRHGWRTDFEREAAGARQIADLQVDAVRLQYLHLRDRGLGGHFADAP